MAPGLKSDFAEKMRKELNDRYAVKHGQVLNDLIDLGVEFARLDDDSGMGWLIMELEGVVSEFQRAAAGLHRAAKKSQRLTK